MPNNILLFIVDVVLFLCWWEPLSVLSPSLLSEVFWGRERRLADWSQLDSLDDFSEKAKEDRETAVALLIYYLGKTGTQRTSIVGDLDVLGQQNSTYAIKVAIIFEWTSISAIVFSIIIFFSYAHKLPRLRRTAADKHECTNVARQWLLQSLLSVLTSISAAPLRFHQCRRNADSHGLQC